MACIFNMSIVSPGCKLFAAGLLGEQWKEKKGGKKLEVSFVYDL